MPALDNSPLDVPAPSLVLLADPDDDTRDVYDAVLTSSGFRTVQAHNGPQAWEKTLQLVPDILVTDVVLPGLDGFELCERLKHHERTNHIPIVAITAYTYEDLIGRANRVGIDALLWKPCEPRVLLNEVQRMLEVCRQLRQRGADARARGGVLSSRPESLLERPEPPHGRVERRNVATRRRVVRLIQSDFEEMPGLSVTVAQGCRLWSLESGACQRILASLVQSGFLTRTSKGTYTRQ